jgi:hypothetical protein
MHLLAATLIMTLRRDQILLSFARIDAGLVRSCSIHHILWLVNDASLIGHVEFATTVMIEKSSGRLTEMSISEQQTIAESLNS